MTETDSTGLALLSVKKKIDTVAYDTKRALSNVDIYDAETLVKNYEDTQAKVKEIIDDVKNLPQGEIDEPMRKSILGELTKVLIWLSTHIPLHEEVEIEQRRLAEERTTEAKKFSVPKGQSPEECQQGLEGEEIHGEPLPLKPTTTHKLTIASPDELKRFADYQRKKDKKPEDYPYPDEEEPKEEDTKKLLKELPTTQDPKHSALLILKDCITKGVMPPNDIWPLINNDDIELMANRILLKKRTQVFKTDATPIEISKLSWKEIHILASRYE